MPDVNRHAAWPSRWRSPRGALVRFVLLLCALGLFTLGYQWGNQYRFGKPPAIQGVLLTPAMPLPAFALVDLEGRPFGRDQLIDRWTLLAFGSLTQARGQLALQRLLDVYNRLAVETGIQQRMQLVLGASQLPEELGLDFQRLSPALRLVSGEAGELGKLASLLGEPSETPPGNQSTLYLIGPHTRCLAVFPPSQSPATVAADLALITQWPLAALEKGAND